MNEHDPHTGKLHIKGVKTGRTRVMTPTVLTAGAGPAVLLLCGTSKDSIVPEQLDLFEPEELADFLIRVTTAHRCAGSSGPWPFSPPDGVSPGHRRAPVSPTCPDVCVPYRFSGDWSPASPPRNYRDIKTDQALCRCFHSGIPQG